MCEGTTQPAPERRVRHVEARALLLREAARMREAATSHRLMMRVDTSPDGQRQWESSAEQCEALVDVYETAEQFLGAVS